MGGDNPEPRRTMRLDREGVREDNLRSSAAVAAALRKQTGGSPTPSTRQSVRYPNPSSRYSRGSVRASVRQPGQSGMSGLSGLAPLERVQVVDEDGRDRTPKSLLSARPHMHPSSNLSTDGTSGWGTSDIGNDTSASERPSLLPQQFGNLASLANFTLDDMPAGAASEQPQVQPLPVTLQDGGWLAAAGGQVGSRPSIGCRADSRLTRPAPMRRAKATQCEEAAVSSHACQVAPWELADTATQQALLEPADTDGLAKGAAASESAAAGDTEAEGGQEGEHEAMQAMREAMLSSQDSYHMAGRDSQMHAESLAERASRAGSSHAMVAHDASRRTSATSSVHQGDLSERGSMMSSRASMGTFTGEGQGGSFMAPRASTGIRSSVMMPGYRQHAPSVSASEAAADAARRQKAEAQRALARLPGIQPRLHHMERLLAQNAFHRLVAQCKHVQLCSGIANPAGAAAEEAAEKGGEQGTMGKTLSMAPVGMLCEDETSVAGDGSASSNAEPKELWLWKSDATEELPVTCIAWNKVSPDLMAAGYGQLEHSVAAKGIVAFYSLANPGHAVWQFSTPCGVSSLDFSHKMGSLLAVGMFDGSVAVYDVRSKSPVPINRVPPTAPDGAGGHAEPVWSIRYVNGEAEAEEMLVSVSTDGRVLSWKHTQSLDHTDLMRLKRQAHRRMRAEQGGQGAHTDGLLGRQAGGTCFEFSPADSHTYLVGTEEGLVHKCSTAFTEQCIHTYSGHSAPVYQVRWAPFRPTCFLTCSADWTMRLWDEAQHSSLWTFQLPNSKIEINDVQWCPYSSTIFVAAAGNTLQLWDLQSSVVRPRVTVTRYGVRLTSVCFSPAWPVLVCGADDGSVTVYSVAGIYKEQISAEREAHRLEAVLQASVYQR